MANRNANKELNHDDWKEEHQEAGVFVQADNKTMEGRVIKKAKRRGVKMTSSTGESLSEALLFAEHGENMLCTKIVLNVRNYFCTQNVLPRFELGIFMY